MNARILLLVPLMGCYTGAQDKCPQHCWGFTQPVDGVMGQFDGVCQHRVTGFMFPPNLPTPSEFHGRLCLDTQAEHNSVKKVIKAVNCGAPGCWSDVDQSDVDIYLELVEGTMGGGGGIGIDARNACMDYLATQDCEVDSLEPGSVHARGLCNEFVKQAAEAAMTDLTGCNGWIPPRKVMGAYSTESSCDFHPDLATTGADTGLVCDDEGVDVTGADSTGADSTGADTTGSSMLGDPFGDVQTLVSCSSPTTCAIDPELLTNVTENFETFYDEGVWLEMVTLAGIGNGAQITGVDSGDDVEALLDAFGIQDEDVITRVNQIELDQEEDVLEVLYEIPRATSWSVTVRRWNGTSWSTLNYSISLAS